MNDKRGRLGDWTLRFCGALAAADGAVWLILWLTGVAGRWSADGALIMKTNMAVSLMLGGLSLVLMSWPGVSTKRRFAAGFLAVAVFVIGGLTLGELFFGFDLGIDQILASELPGAVATVSPNRMGPPGSLNLVLLGVGLLALAIGRRKIVPYLGLAVCLISLTPLVGFLYGIADFYSRPRLTGMAWPTAMAMLALGAGLILAARDAGWISMLTASNPAGALLRRLLPAVILIPLAFGLAHVVAERAGWVGSSEATGMLVISLIIVSSVVVWTSAIRLRRTESSLEESEGKYRNLFENMTEEVHFWKLVRDEQGRVQTWRLVEANPPALKTWGRSAIEEVRGKTTDEIFGPGSTEHYRPIVEKIMAEGAPHSFEDYFPNLDKHFRFTSVPLGEYFITTGADITGVKKAQQQIEQAYSRLKAFFDVRIGGIGIIIARADGSVLQANDYYLDILGHTRQEFEAGKVTWIDRTPPEWIPADERALAQLRDRGACDPYEKEYVRRDGRRVPVLITDVMMPGPEKDILAIVVNMTERKRAEEALQESEARFRLALRNAPVSLAAQDRGLRFIWAYNQRSSRPDQIIGHTDHDIFTPQEAAHFVAIKQRVLDEGIEHREQLWLDRPTGRMYLDIFWEPIRNPDGEIVGVASATMDLTPIKLAEEALRESEGRFRALTETSSLAVGVSSSDGRFLYVNEAYQKLFGYTEKELDRLNASELWRNPEDRRRMTEAIRSKGFLMDHEVELKRKDGTLFWAVLSANSVEYGGSQAIMASVSDITARKQAEEALRESEERAKALVRYAPTGIYEIDLKGKRFITVNEAMCQTLGYTREELLAIGPMAVLDEESRVRFTDRVKRNLSGQPVDEAVEYRVLKKDGSAIDAVLYVTFSIAGDRALVVAHDVTERKKTEALRQALAEQDRVRLGAAVEQASDSVVMFDLDGTIRYVNSAFEAANRIPRGAAVGRSYFNFFAGHPSDAAIRKAIAHGQSWHGSMSRLVPDGGTIDLEVTISPAKDLSGTVLGGLATETDVTQKNALQQQIRQAQKMEALGTLAGGITHDFNNILGTIIINTELALLDMDLSDPARAPLPIVLQAANRGKELVKQIITFSRQRAWERKPLEIAPVVREGMGLLRSTLPKNISVHDEIDPRSGIVLADPSHLHQILVNLCQNAALAMMERGGDLEVGLGPIEVDAFMAVRNPDLKPGPYVRLTVSDTGCGMESEILDRIFEPFFTTREQSKGSGLGLSVVHGIVKSYDGAIAVRSQPGKGSVFSIYFHRLDGAAPAAGLEPPAKAVGGRERILLVEDEETQRASLARGLEHLGFKITAAADGRSALAKFRKAPKSFDLVVTDQIMPKMSGLELASELAKIRPDLPVILCTGFSEKVDDGTIERYGIRELVMKPFTITEITRAIGKAVKKGGP